MRAMYHMAVFVAEGVPVFDIRGCGRPDGSAGQDSGARSRAGKGLWAGNTAALMRGHGAVVTASSIPNVVGRSIYLDINARAQMQAIALRRQGHLRGTVEEAKLRMVDPNEYARAWDLWKRKVSR